MPWVEHITSLLTSNKSHYFLLPGRNHVFTMQSLSLLLLRASSAAAYAWVAGEPGVNPALFGESERQQGERQTAPSIQYTKVQHHIPHLTLTLE
jgi:hypothetical protein